MKYHAMPGEFRVGLKDAVGRGVIASSIHCIRASFVQRSRKSHIASIPPCDSDFGHDVKFGGLFYTGLIRSV